jgi:hypothetical protein
MTKIEAAWSKATPKLESLIKPVTRPASYLAGEPVKAPENQALVSHFGGLPYLEEGEAWPGGEVSGAPALEFVFQVFQDEAGSIALPPGVKLLQCFLAPDDGDTDDDLYDGNDHHYQSGYGDTEAAYKIILRRSITGTPGKVQPPRGLAIRPYASLKTEQEDLIPEYSDLCLLCPKTEKVFASLKPLMEDPYAAPYWEMVKRLDFSVPEMDTYLGGYPYRVDADNDSGEGEKDLRGWQHLFQLVENYAEDFGNANNVNSDPLSLSSYYLVNAWYDPDTGETYLFQMKHNVVVNVE